MCCFIVCVSVVVCPKVYSPTEICFNKRRENIKCKSLSKTAFLVVC